MAQYCVDHLYPLKAQWIICWIVEIFDKIGETLRRRWEE